MVVSESADYMSADLAPNRTYYALVTPRFGIVRERFSLCAGQQGRENTCQDAQNCLKDCRLVENTQESEGWARENMTDIRAKHSENYSRWNQKPSNEKPHLARDDGV